MDWKLSLMLLMTASAVSYVQCQSLAELAKMAGINLKDVAGAEGLDKEEVTTSAFGLRGLLGRAGLLGSASSSSSSSSSSSNSPTKSASSASSATSSPSLGSSPCGNCGNCPSCLLKQMKLMNSDFGGFPSGSESGYPGMMGLSHMGLGGDAETLSAMNSPFASGMGGIPASPYGGMGAGPANFIPSDSYAPFVGAPSSIMPGMGGGYEELPESIAMQRYPLHEEESPRPYPVAGRSRARYREPAARPVEYDPEQAPVGGEEDSGPGDAGPVAPQYDQGPQEQEAPAGYMGNQEAGGEDQQSGYARQPEPDQEAPQSEHRSGSYQNPEFARSHSYFDKK